MRASTAPLTALLDGSNVFQMCDLLEIVLATGTTLRYAGGDRPVVFNGNTYSTAVGFRRTGTKVSSKLTVDTCTVSLLTGGTATLGSAPLTRAVADGAFDDARVTVRRAFFNATGVLVGALDLFVGNVAGVDPGGLEVRLSVKSDLERLNVKLPRMLYQPACSLTVYGVACGVSRESFTGDFVVGASPTTSRLPWAGNVVAGNLCQRSQEFGNARWTPVLTAVTSDADVAPDGTMTGDRMFETAASGQHRLGYPPSTQTFAAGTYTLTVYAKAGVLRSALQLRIGAASVGAIFNLANGTVQSNFVGTTAFIRPAANGWWRCSVTGTIATALTSGDAIYLTAANSSFGTSYLGDVTAYLSLWGAQIVAGADPGAYQPTTGVAIAPGTTPAGFFNLGVVQVVSGANAGLRRAVSGDSAGILRLSVPLPTLPLAGDRIVVTAGCDHAAATCTGRFANLTRYRGFPYVPRPEDAR